MLSELSITLSRIRAFSSSAAKLPEEAAAVLEGLHGGSAASYAIRIAAGFEDVVMVLSGMGTLEMVQDNVSYMKDFKPLDAVEREALAKLCGIIRKQNLIACTSCHYCTEGCPAHIAIPELFACLNAHNAFHNWNTGYYYRAIHTANGGKASDCVKCGKCELACPQHLPVRKLLEEVANVFEKK